jgi:hypothetical protein
MSLNWPIHTVANRERFWTDYFWLTEPDYTGPGYAELINHHVPLSAEAIAEYRLLTDGEPPETNPYCRLDLPVGGGYGLGLEFDPSCACFDLALLLPGGRRCPIAWDDQAHWHPHVLRWEELDLVCKCAAIQDATLPHPGLPLLLLYRFAPITESDNVDRIFPLIRDAWRSLGLFGEEQIRQAGQRVDKRGSKFEWRLDDRTGWTLHQENWTRGQAKLYTRRSGQPAPTENGVAIPESLDDPDYRFPFAEYRRMVEAARAMCAGLLRPEWMRAGNGAVQRVAAEIDTTKDFTHLPILADALEDAGCDVALVLTHCRQQVPLRAGSWVVDTILDKPWTLTTPVK